ncbi:hypothetical protein [Acinetobacter proteolyticus]|uniref:Uncharacterized protein n=1 Tax=Acinetobacter proteolyticus TaxID=1776741 RepID=A0A2N0WIG1_9GAMM|nr:hypothetical protein [Acinetobacter proteolyticus]PKF35551.1 hypothetical protein CW311_04480 [Acinetobacter proteolyticus]
MFNNTYTGVKTRLNYCYDLLRANGQLEGPNQPDKNIIILKSKINTLRELINGEQLPAHKILLTSDSYAENYIASQLSEINSLPEGAEKLSKLLKLKNNIEVQSASVSTDPTRNLQLRNYRNEVEPQIALRKKYLRNMVDHTIEGSKIKGVFDVDKAQSLLNDDAKLLEEYNGKHGDAFQKLSAIYSEVFEPYKTLKRTLDAEMATITNHIEREQFYQGRYDELKALYDKANAEYEAEKEKLYLGPQRELAAAQAKIKEQKVIVAKAVKDAVLAQSKVTYEDAKNWVSNQVTITAAVINKMKKNGITQDQFNKDLQDFFVITNGRLGKIIIDTKNHDRAYASGTNDHTREGVVMLDNRFEQRTLWHELAHHLEADDALNMVANEYIRSRSLDGDNTHQLRKLVGNKAYGTDEIAYKTDMFNHYVAKIYKSGITEVYSMGVEAFYDEESLFNIMLKDPKTLEFVSAALMQTPEEIDRINQKLRDSLLDVNAEAENGKLQNYQIIFNQLALLVDFKDGSTYTKEDLGIADQKSFDELAAKFYGTLTLPNGKTLTLLKSAKVKFKSFRGRAMRGFFALDFADHAKFKQEFGNDPNLRYFFYGYGARQEVNFPIQSLDMEVVKVTALSMDYHRRAGYSIADTKGNLGEGFLSYDMLENLKKHYLNGGNDGH